MRLVNRNTGEKTELEADTPVESTEKEDEEPSAVEESGIGGGAIAGIIIGVILVLCLIVGGIIFMIRKGRHSDFAKTHSTTPVEASSPTKKSGNET